MFVYKHTETMNMLKSSLLFNKNENFMGKITREFLGLAMQNFLGIVFIWSQAYTTVTF